MKAASVLLILYFSICIQNCSTKRDVFRALVIKLAIDTALNQVKKIGNIVLIRHFDLRTPAFLNKTIYGDIGVKNVTLYGLSTLKHKDKVIVDSINENNVTVRTYKVNVNATLDKLGINLKYNTDLVIVSILPFYGKGIIQLEVKDIDVKFNIVLNDRKKINVQELEIELSFRSSNQSYITGFWNNFRVSTFLTKALNIVIDFFTMFYHFYKKCFECIISRILHFLTNIILVGDARYTRCSCFKENNPIENFEAILESWPNKTITQIADENLGDPEKVRELLIATKDVLRNILKHRDHLDQLILKNIIEM